MSTKTKNIIELATTLSVEKDLRVTVKETLKGGLIAGVTTIIGGVTLGPLGLALGGALGGCTAAYLTWGRFKPLAQVIYEMDPSQQMRLATSIQNVLNDLSWQDFPALLALVTGNPVVQAQVLKAIYSFVQSELQMKIID